MYIIKTETIDSMTAAQKEKNEKKRTLVHLDWKKTAKNKIEEYYDEMKERQLERETEVKNGQNL